MEDLYTVPHDVRLDSADLRSALAGIGIDAYSYVANGVSNHVFVNRACGAKLSVVVCGRSNRLSEVVGDTALWHTVREVAVYGMSSVDILERANSSVSREELNSEPVG